ncbi:MAG: sigma-70 family RNA polymerase sigma factor [Oscillospiraceae bacterium]|nr:sigma-70 family RNA polymerase sigma factor [Oscillospiraceae bacterium]
MEDLLNVYAREYMSGVYYFCLRKTRGAAEAEELCSEITAAVADRLRRGDSPNNFKAWVYAVARNVAARRAKDSIRRRENESPEAPEDLRDAFDLQEDLENRESVELLRRELSILAREYREIVVAFYIDDRSVADIAKSLGIPVGTVKWRLHESRKHLKEGIQMSRSFGPRSYKPENVRFMWGVVSENTLAGVNQLREHLEERKILKNILLEAYENPSAPEDLSLALGVALPYLEDELALLERAGLLKKTGDRYKTNFHIISAETQEEVFNAAEARRAEAFELTKALARETLPELRRLARVPDGMSDGDLLWFLLPHINHQALDYVSQTALPGIFEFEAQITGFANDEKRKYLNEHGGLLEGVTGFIYGAPGGAYFCGYVFPEYGMNIEGPGLSEKYRGFSEKLDADESYIPDDIPYFVKGCYNRFGETLYASEKFTSIKALWSDICRETLSILRRDDPSASNAALDERANSLVYAASTDFTAWIIRSAVADGTLTVPNNPEESPLGRYGFMWQTP